MLKQSFIATFLRNVFMYRDEVRHSTFAIQNRRAHDTIDKCCSVLACKVGFKKERPFFSVSCIGLGLEFWRQNAREKCIRALMKNILRRVPAHTRKRGVGINCKRSIIANFRDRYTLRNGLQCTVAQTQLIRGLAPVTQRNEHVHHGLHEFDVAVSEDVCIRRNREK